MITISKSKLKAQMLSIFRQIEETGEEVVVTDNGKPVLRIERIRARKPVEEVFADVRGKVAYYEDINTPTIEEWEDA